MAKKKQEITNVMRILTKSKIKFTAHEYIHDEQNFDGVTVANQLNEPVDKVFKTLVTKGAHDYFVFVIPVAKELDLKIAAKSVGEKAVAMLHVKDINSITGYIRGGCSPIGMKKNFKTVIDESAKEFNTIFISGGKRGTQVELNPMELSKLINSDFAHITQ